MIVNGLIYGMFLGGVLLSQYPLLMSTLHGLLFRLRIRADLIRRPETARYRAYGPFLQADGEYRHVRAFRTAGGVRSNIRPAGCGHRRSA